ncbi:MAG: MBL fold metallo-hydrolase [Chloroflexi bacterium]|nr:MBL fold metallo-hydrolase [Chloroflexota bacterium]
MLTVIYLGTGAAVPSPGRDNTSLALDDGEEITLVDASGAPTKRLAEAGLDARRLRRVIMTHEHLDHTYGFPSLFQSLWLSGRREPLAVYAQPETWRFLDRLVDAYRPGGWTAGLPVERHTIVPGSAPVVETPRLTVWADRTQHPVPTVGLRIETVGGSIIAYSADTSPSRAVQELAQRADLLIHEATFLAGQEDDALRYGHATARQAGEVATQAGVERLAVLHFTPRGPTDLGELRAGAASVFAGGIDVPSDQDRIEFP